MKKAYYGGFNLYEYVDGVRFQHFRKHSVLYYEVAIARIHDLVRNKYWSEPRSFEIWDGINYISKVICSRTDEGRTSITIIDAVPEKAYEKDLEIATRYKKTSKYGAVAADTTNWIKKGALDRVPVMMIDKTSWIKTDKMTSRSLKN